MNNTLFLFCGGTLSDLDRNVPKPLLKINFKKTILNAFLSSLPNEIWTNVILLVERRFENDFLLELENIKETLKFDVEIVLCGDETSTLEKFAFALNQCRFNSATFSYPDIFSQKEFWEFEEKDCVQIKKVVVKSRFPRISNGLFSEKVLGVTLHSSEMPANPHYIYGGVMTGKKDSFETIYEKFKLGKISNAVLEVDFLNFIASEFELKSELYSGEWVLADGPREYDLVSRKYLM